MRLSLCPPRRLGAVSAVPSGHSTARRAFFRFRFLLAGDRKNAVCDFQTDVLLIEPGQFGGDAHLLVRLVDIDLGQPSPSRVREVGPNGARSNPRNTSSNMRFISRCNVKNGLTSVARWKPTSRPLLFQGMRSLMAMVCKRLPPRTSRRGSRVQ